VYTEAEDGALLSGAITAPRGTPRDTAVVWIHGSSFHSFLPFVSRIAAEVARGGYRFIAANTRGRDVGAVTTRRNAPDTLGGTWWELFEESPLDLAAWIDLAQRQWSSPSVLIGHSFGALKVLHYQETRGDPRVKGIVLASPSLGKSVPDPTRVGLAERMVAEGRGTELLPWLERDGPWATASAQTYLSKSRARTDVLGLRGPALIAEVDSPILAFFGSHEDIGDQEDLDLLQSKSAPNTTLETRMIPDANHVYAGREVATARIIVSWLDGLR
jgi:alpha-beta hydrolase superfamily lysophospholipase